MAVLGQTGSVQGGLRAARGKRARKALAVVVLGVATLVPLTAAANVTKGAPDRTRPSPDPVPEATGLTTLGRGGWEVLSSARTTASGAAISEPGFATTQWLPVQPDDAGAPGTEIEALLQNGACPDVFYSTNMEKCFGYEHRIGADTVPRFDVPWWFRTDFHASLAPGQHATLIVPGVVGAADLWLNGTEVATAKVIEGDDTHFTFDVTDRLLSGTNSLAFEVDPNNPQTMFTLDDVDWSQIPPDNNTGIQFPVQLQITDAVDVGNDYVTEDNAADMSSSSLTVHADVTNHSNVRQRTTVAVTITPPAGGGPAIAISQPVLVAPDSTATVTFTPATFPALVIAEPLLWWPYQMGGQPLYQLQAGVGRRHRHLPGPARDLRHPDGDHFAHRRLGPGPAGGAPLRHQRGALPGAGRRVGREPVPALLVGRRGQPDRPHQEPGAQRGPHRGQGDAGRLLPSRWTGPGS